MKAIINVNIYDFNTYRENQYIIFDKKIIETGDMSRFSKNDCEVINANGALVMPGLVNAHSHIYSTFARGMAVPFNPQNFQEILDQLWWKLDAELDNEATYYSGIVFGVDTVKNGVTTLIDHHASGRDITGSLESLKKSVCDKVGLRGVFCFETSDRFDVDECIKENVEFAEKYKSDKTCGLFGMHAAMSLSGGSLDKIGRYELPVHVHVAESKMDQEISIEKYENRVIERFSKHGILKKNSLLAHCLYINEKEAGIIKENGCKVVLNVSSNMNNGVGLPDYNLLKKYDIPVLIGNDGISSGIVTEWLSLYYAMHLKEMSPTAFGLDDLLKMINNNYEYVSELLGCKLGRIEKDYEADLLMIDYVAPTQINSGNALGHIFFGMANSFKPSDVWCGGEQIVKDYKVRDDLMGEYRKASGVASRIWERLE